MNGLKQSRNEMNRTKHDRNQMNQTKVQEKAIEPITKIRKA